MTTESSSITAPSSTNSTNGTTLWDAESFPSHVIVNFSPIIYRYIPTGRIDSFVSWIPDHGPGREAFLNFLMVFPIHKFIEAALVLYYESHDQESLIFEYIEAAFPEGCPIFDDANAEYMELSWWIELLWGTVSEEADLLIRHVFEHSQIRYPYTDYLFSHWVDATSAVLVHRSLPYFSS